MLYTLMSDFCYYREKDRNKDRDKDFDLGRVKVKEEPLDGKENCIKTHSMN